MNKKVSFAALLLLLLISIPIFCMASTNPIEIYINGQKINSDVPPMIVNDRTIAPVRVISENLGAQVTWDNDNRLVEITTPSKKIILKIDDTKALVNGQEVILDVPAKIVNDRTMVPLRFIGETLGAKVDWDNNLRRVIINRTSTKIIDLAYEVIEGRKTVVIKGDSPLEYFMVETQEDNRFAIDVKGNLDNSNNPLFVNDSYLDKVVAREIASNPPITRIVLELQPNVTVKANTSSDKTCIYLSFTSFDNILEDLTFDSKRGEFLATIETTKATSADYFFLSNPDRLVLDIKDILLTETPVPKIPKNDFVEDVRIGQFAEDTVRVVFDLKNDLSYQVVQDGNVFSIIFSKAPSVEDIKVTSQGDKTYIEILASDKTDYELKEDKLKRQLKVVIPGAANLLDRNVIKIADGIIDHIELAKVKGDKNYNLEIIINLNAFPSYEILSSSPTDNIELAFYSSSSLTPLKNKLIVIDPGHGGSDPGAVVGNVKEKDLNLDIALKLKTLLEANGAKVFMTREDDTFVNLYARAEMANKLNADLFISIHHNAATSNATGTETLYYPDPEKKLFAQALQRAVVSYTGFHNRGIIERPGIVVTRETKMPSALVEVGFLTNPNDLAHIMTDEFKQKVAQGILQGIVDYISGKTN